MIPEIGLPERNGTRTSRTEAGPGWKEFMEYLIRKHGKTRGGIISQKVENAIKRPTERGKTGA